MEHAEVPPHLSSVLSRRAMKKTVLCKYFPANTCTRGAACRFAHDLALLSDRPSPPETRLAVRTVSEGEEGIASFAALKSSNKISTSHAASSEWLKDESSLPTGQGYMPRQQENQGQRIGRNRQRKICLDFQRGRCKRNSCWFRHDQPKSVCETFQLTGHCVHGLHCQALHEQHNQQSSKWLVIHGAVTVDL
ncbi:unnamed protein product [Effrenium voratum]|uniref:C3H1-type domain-containing protein n=1 Tax=Effrenium voratum TaxID=2562239 RepID=A0AA36MGD6_9DINO|nr:unnamed protein product [Effrenium voratum]